MHLQASLLPAQLPPLQDVFVPAKMPTIDDYLTRVTAEQRAALEKVRKAIQAAAPEAQECISYGIPAFQQGKKLVAFGATAKHCAFYPMSGSMIDLFATELAGFDTSKGTIRFQPDKPLPVTLIKKIVKSRLEENGIMPASKTAAKKKATK